MRRLNDSGRVRAGSNHLACLLRAGLLIAACCITYASRAAEQELERTGGPFVPTPQVVVDQSCAWRTSGRKDFRRLGSGDG